MSHYIAPRFLDKLAVHLTKNYLDLPGLKVPLILGIHGRKGEGKSYQCELVFERMGVAAIHMSAGELESPDAGDPSRLIRLRYREAAELVRVRGQMAALMINDLDAGAGRLDRATQYTVNTQLVHGTLMNIADNPTNVQLPGSYDETPICRVPIVVTGNDFSTLYAPLIRDGRMEKFYWEPDRSDRIGIVAGIFSGELTAIDVEQLVDTFPGQAIDFFSALRARLYDEQIRQFIHKIGLEKVSKRLVNSVEPPPVFTPPDFSLSRLLAFGQQMVEEQHRIYSSRLTEEYLSRALHDSPPTSEMPKQSYEAVLHAAKTPPQFTNIAAGVRSSSTMPEQNGTAPLSNLCGEVLQKMLGHGHQIGVEYVDRRRFRTNAWQCYTIVPDEEQAAIAAIARCLSEHPQDYVRLVSIDPDARRRLHEVIVQRPN